MNLSAIILAAGQGTRMKSQLPKVMHKLAGKPMLGHVLSSIKSLNLREVLVIRGPEMAEFEQYVQLEMGSARCVVQHDRKGSADAVKVGVAHLQDTGNDMLVLYGDHPLITTSTIEKMYQCLLENEKNALVLISFIAADPAQYGRVITAVNGITQIIEYFDCSEAEKEINLCNSGIMLIRGKLLRPLLAKVNNHNNKSEYYLTDLVAIAREDGWLCQHLTIDEDEVMGVNTRADLVTAEKIMQHHLRQKAMAAGASLLDPDHVHFSMDTVLEQDVVVHPYVVFAGGVRVGSGSEIRSFSHLEGTIIDKNVKIGPFARIRPGTEVAENAVLGNFIEIKNSKIAAGAKINHLSYVGDAVVGAKANVGAGTITCNYDGVNKHKTEIGAGAFIGSNTALVAPVKIGDDAIIAAGSVITKNVAAGALGVARAEQKNIDGKAAVIKGRQNKSWDGGLEM